MLPDGDTLLEQDNQRLCRFERWPSMPSADSQEQRCLGYRHKTDPVMQNYAKHGESFSGFVDDLGELMPCHFLMCFVVDPGDGVLAFESTHHAIKIYDATCFRRELWGGRQEGGKRQEDFPVGHGHKTFFVFTGRLLR